MNAEEWMKEVEAEEILKIVTEDGSLGRFQALDGENEIWIFEGMERWNFY